MDLLEVLSNYGAMGVFVILVWILIQQVLNEANQNRDLYKTSVEEFHKTVNEFSLTIKGISNEVRDTNVKIDDLKHDMDDLKLDIRDIKQHEREGEK
ncbi:MAG: hypothetical protein ACLS90_00700 [Clostridia bacterium]|jgi:uncharacterized coiled-coil DUF342 family protein|nr:MAG TPA: holin family protein [Caudoviricetes sp.]DAJ41438.1 MAG TPA: holin family protein [Caudoviricetes sp.]DAK80353.1 MAG TPA: holin family protein [Caudoviricetes sp.]DAO35092.1 MAG TPA: holin family protein [Caudoviricetes sp.]DAU18199.1 MAG TPA: holin family protein [Caudoviricetes sp.]